MVDSGISHEIDPRKEGALILKSLAVVSSPIILMTIVALVSPFPIPLWIWIFVLLVSFLLLWGVSYFWLAKEDIFFTFVPEGTAKIVIRNEAYHKTLMSYSEHFLDEDGFILDKEDKKEREEAGILVKEAKPDVCQRICNIIFFGKGLFFLGVWPFDRIYQYEFSWTSIENGQVKEHKKRLVDYIFLKTDVYLIKLSYAEDKDNLPLDVEVVVTMAVVSPDKALMKTDRWYDAVCNYIQAQIRSEISRYSFAELINRRDTAGDKELGNEIYGRLNSLPNTPEKDINYGVKSIPGSELWNIKSNFGVEIKDIGITKIDTSDGRYREITLRKINATEDAKVTVIKADADAYAVTKAAEAKASAIRAIGEANADQQIETTSGAVLRAFLKELGISYIKYDDKGNRIGTISHEEIVTYRKTFPELWDSVQKANMEKLRLDSHNYIHIKGSGQGGSTSPLAEALVLSEFLKNKDIFGKDEKSVNTRQRNQQEQKQEKTEVIDQEKNKEVNSPRDKEEKKKKPKKEEKEDEEEKEINPAIQKFMEDSGLDEDDLYT